MSIPLTWFLEGLMDTVGPGNLLHVFTLFVVEKIHVDLFRLLAIAEVFATY